MSGFSGDQLLSLYANGKETDARTRRALLTQSSLRPVSALDRKAQTLGDVDRALCQQLELLTERGESLDLMCTCPSCGETLEFQLPLVTLQSMAKPPAQRRSVSIVFERASHEIRLPCLGDITAGGLDLLSLSPDAPWESDAFRSAAEAALAEADPMLHPTLALTCSLCGAQITIDLDMAALLWQQVENVAHPLVQDVIALSQGLGWTEQEIVAMSPARRRL
ncbi:MAG: hypothetical protein AAGA78_03220, partial [Pseudomonadota bacterium]